MNLNTLIFIGIGLALIYGLFTIGFPFLLALLLVILMEPIVQFLIRKLRIKRPFSAVLVATLFSLLFLLSFVLIVLKAAKEAVGLSSFLLKLVKRVTENVDTLSDQTQILFNTLPPSYQAGITQVFNASLDTLQGFLSTLAEFSLNIATMIPNFFLETLIFFIAFYIISLQLPNIRKSFYSIFDPSTHKRIDKLMASLYKAVIGFIRAQIILSIIIFLLTAVAFTFLKVNYALATALLVTIVDFLPIFGAGSVIVPMAIYKFVTNESLLGIGLLIHYGILIIFRRVAEPKLVGNAVGISALSALVSMYLGFKLVGFIGLIMGPAIVIIFVTLVREDIIKLNIKF